MDFSIMRMRAVSSLSDKSSATRLTLNSLNIILIDSGLLRVCCLVLVNRFLWFVRDVMAGTSRGAVLADLR